MALTCHDLKREYTAAWCFTHFMAITSPLGLTIQCHPSQATSEFQAFQIGKVRIL